jgi:hypothetical protein
LQRILAIHCANPSTVLLVTKNKLHPQIVRVLLATCEWIKVFDQVQVTVTALVNAVAVEAIAKLHEKVASPSTATPTLTESMSAGNTRVFPACAVSVNETGLVPTLNPRTGDSALSIEPVSEPVTS